MSASTPADAPLPRRSATSPSQWEDWNPADEDDLPVIPTRSARLVDSVPPPMPTMPRRSPQVAPIGRRYIDTETTADRPAALPRRSATSPSQWLAWEEEDDDASALPTARRTLSEVQPVSTEVAQVTAPTASRTRWAIIFVALALLGVAVGVAISNLL